MHLPLPVRCVTIRLLHKISYIEKHRENREKRFVDASSRDHFLCSYSNNIQRKTLQEEIWRIKNGIIT